MRSPCKRGVLERKKQDEREKRKEKHPKTENLERLEDYMHMLLLSILPDSIEMSLIVELVSIMSIQTGYQCTALVDNFIVRT